MSLKFVGLEHYDTLINKDPQYLTNVGGSLVPILYSLPLIVLISMVLGILLNQKFRGRLFFRALYFLPVIIATGAVIEILFTTTSSDISSSATSDSFSSNMLSLWLLLLHIFFSPIFLLFSFWDFHHVYFGMLDDLCSFFSFFFCT